MQTPRHEYDLISVDDHIIEPATVWTDRLSAKYQDIGPHVVEEDGREYWEYEGERLTTMGLNAVCRHPWPNSQGEVRKALSGVPADEVAAMTHANAERLFRWDERPDVEAVLGDGH